MEFLLTWKDRMPPGDLISRLLMNKIHWYKVIDNLKSISYYVEIVQRHSMLMQINFKM